MSTTSVSSGAAGPARASRVRPGWILAAALWFATLVPAAAASRLSLVIGNDNYQTIGKLKNPGADAQLIEGKLKEIGFEVDRVADADKATLSRSIRDFGRKIAAAGPGATVLVYYAGHGIQDRGTNYIVPVDADLKVRADLATEAVNLDTLIKMLEQSNVKVGIVVLDACRDSPLPADSRTTKRGLAVEERPGLYIAFSTDPNNVALDGDGVNSPYAEALAAEIATPGIEIERVFKNVRTRVFEATNGKQQPWESSRLMQEVFLAGAGAVVRPDTGTTVQPTGPDPELEYLKALQVDTAEIYEKLLQRFPNHPRRQLVVSLVQRKAEESLWKQAEAVRGRPEETAVLDRLITAFDQGIYADRARERRDAIRREADTKKASTSPELSDRAQTDFDKATRLNTADAWNAFLRTNPNGSLATLARYQLTLLTAAQAQSVPKAEATGSYHYVTGLDPNGDNWLALRSAPNSKSPWSKTRLTPDMLVTVTGTSGEWHAVTLQSGETGWASSRYLACCRSGNAAPLRQQASTTGSSYHYVTGLDPKGDNWLALRSAPSSQAPWSQTRMGPGTLLKVTGTQGEWYRVTLQSGETGWASRQYVACCRSP